MSYSCYKDIYKILCERHPNRKIYVISDHHFYHSNIISYHRTEFDNIFEMHEHIINKHNSIVGSDDIVIFLGDFCFKKAAIKSFLEQMNGHKYLLLGNHDSNDLINCYGKLGFEGIFTNPVKINDAYLSHNPLQKDEMDNVNFQLLVKEFNKSNGFNYHGHIHTCESVNLPFINVCCEAQNYEPLLIGYTENLIQTDDLPLIINSPEFNNILKFLKEKKSLEPSLVISDYIYTSLLEATMQYHDSSFVYGSFPLYKKYGYISNFSDLDVCLIYNEDASKNRNQASLKQMFDTAFESIQSIDNVNFSIDKRISNICIFELLYTDIFGNKYRGYYDANLVPLDVYRDTDFLTTCGCSTLEIFLKEDIDLIEKFKLPKYQSRFLTVNGDIANMSLQMLFQQDLNSKKDLILKKLRNIYRMCGQHDISNTTELDDIISRFFIRNILFFHTTRRKKEIDYINAGNHNFDSFMEVIPLTLKIQMEEILKNPHSLFNYVYQELSNVEFAEIPNKSNELIKMIKL